MILRKSILSSFFYFIVLFLVLEISSSALIPAIFSSFYLPQFMPLFVLFIGIRWDSSIRPLLILFLNIIHGAFSVEGWAIGSFIGVLLSWPLGILREIIHFSSSFVLIIFSCIFYSLWFFLATFIFAMKNDQYHLIKEYTAIILIKSLLLAIITPLVFIILDKIWMGSSDSQQGH